MVAGSRGNKAHNNRSVPGSKGGWGGRGKAHSNRSVPGSKGGWGGRGKAHSNRSVAGSKGGGKVHSSNGVLWCIFDGYYLECKIMVLTSKCLRLLL